ncbi:MAG TPA: hypothetical protein VGY77_04405, partial [Gemmataceae bacterium]|nr:hypothetical protein [Gemmataceae bacterium]
LRIPGWCNSSATLEVNGQVVKSEPVHGYITIARTWKAGDIIHLQLPMAVERVYSHPQVKANVGRVALQRGPIVYCLEGVDNDGHVRNLCLPKDANLTASFEKDRLGGVVVVRGQAQAVLGKDEKRLVKQQTFEAVPYAMWDNRQPGEMVVWLPETPALAEIPGDDGVVSNGIRIRASHCWANDTLTALNDGQLPKSSGDHSIPRMTWWDHRGSTEWVSYRFPKPRKVSATSVYWFDDTGRGSCRVPAEWRLLWLDGSDWKPVRLTGGTMYSTTLDTFNSVTFEPIATRELKLEVKLKPDFSGGILEWKMNE